MAKQDAGIKTESSLEGAKNDAHGAEKKPWI
jgi:hypothetical protein